MDTLSTQGGQPQWRLPLRVAFLLAVVGALITLYLVNPSEQPLMPHCPFKLLTGLDCPGCGFQRATHALLHGHVREAIGYNLFLLFALPYLLALLTERTLLKGNTRQRWQNALESKPMIIFYVVTYGVWFVVRNILHL